MVSVRNPAEAKTALRADADLIDVKEPTRGPLGPPTPEVAAAVANVVGAERPVSVALGEVVDLQPGLYERLLSGSGVQFAKIGLAGLGERPAWWRAWQRVWSRVPEQVGRVGVVYVDWQAAAAPRPDAALTLYAESGCAAVLFDTWTKDGRTLLDLAPRGQLAEWTEQVRSTASLLVLAGSLTADDLFRIREYRPDHVAVRGAVCRQGRSGEVSGARIRRFADGIRAAFAPINL